AARGDFIRRVEFDDFLLRRSGASVIQGHTVSSLERQDGAWIVDRTYVAPLIVGAGGTNCPVARTVFPGKPGHPVAAQEREFEADAAEGADARIGADGEPELLLHDDLGGYSGNVPQGARLNVRTGTAAPRRGRAGGGPAAGGGGGGGGPPGGNFFPGGGLPRAGAGEPLSQPEGHAYYLFDPANLDSCHQDGAFLVGDALGLAHPLTAEGILPAVV